MATQQGYYRQYIPGDNSTPVDLPREHPAGEIDEDGHPARYCNIIRDDGSTCGALCRSNKVSQGEKTRGKILYMCQEKEPSAPIVNGYPQSHGYNGFVDDDGQPQRFPKPAGGGGGHGAQRGLAPSQRQEQVQQAHSFSMVEVKERVSDLVNEGKATRETLARLADQVGYLFALARQKDQNKQQVQQAVQQTSLPVAPQQQPRSNAPGQVAYPGAQASTDVGQYHR